MGDGTRQRVMKAMRTIYLNSKYRMTLLTVVTSWITACTEKVREGKRCGEKCSGVVVEGVAQHLEKVRTGGSRLSCPVSGAAPTSRLA